LHDTLSHLIAALPAILHLTEKVLGPGAIAAIGTYLAWRMVISTLALHAVEQTLGVSSLLLTTLIGLAALSYLFAMQPSALQAVWRILPRLAAF
jgi:hypothetical protein